MGNHRLWDTTSLRSENLPFQSQRDCVPQPRVAPRMWGYPGYVRQKKIEPTPTGLCPSYAPFDDDATPLGLEMIFSPAPQGRSIALQPGAMRRNPVGIQELSINSLLNMVGFPPFWNTRIISRRLRFLGSRCCGSARGCRGLAFAGILCHRAWRIR